jgi:hypothetical protein
MYELFYQQASFTSVWSVCRAAEDLLAAQSVAMSKQYLHRVRYTKQDITTQYKGTPPSI